MLQNNEEIFNDILCNYTGTEYNIEILEGAKPCYIKPFLIPKVYQEILKIEGNR